MYRKLLFAVAPIFAIIHIFMRYAEWAAKGLGWLNDWYLEKIAKQSGTINR